jgi:hypothetical protein
MAHSDEATSESPNDSRPGRSDALLKAGAFSSAHFDVSNDCCQSQFQMNQAPELVLSKARVSATMAHDRIRRRRLQVEACDPCAVATFIARYTSVIKISPPLCV